MIKLVLLRHGESIWNKENRFTGWTDVDLSELGINEAKNAGQLLQQVGHNFDLAFTSVLKRGIRTTWIVLDQMDLMWIPVIKAWQLNERHYGALQGLNKSEMTSRYGGEQVRKWRRSYDIRPVPLRKTDKMYPGNDPKYKALNKKHIPLTESLKDTYDRMVPYWKKEIAPLLKKRKRILISAHGNSLRALVKYIDKIPDDKIVEYNIPTGVPLVYDLDESLRPLKHYFLGDALDIEKKINAVKNQTIN